MSILIMNQSSPNDYLIPTVQIIKKQKKIQNTLVPSKDIIHLIV